MGGGGSQTIKNEMNFQSTTKILEENITENTNKVNAAAIQANKMKLSIGVNPITGEQFGEGPALKNCKVVIAQTADADVQSEATLTTQSILESKQKIQDSMQANLSSAMEKSTQAGNFQFGDKQNSETKINQEIETVVENVFKTENLNEVVSSVVQTNEADLMIGNMDCSLGGELDVTQDLTAKVAATAVMGQVIEKLMETEAVKELAAEIDSKQTTENKGAAEVVDSVGDAAAGVISATTGPLKYAMLAIVLICCLLMIGGVAIAMSPAGQKGLNKGFNQMSRGGGMPMPMMMRR
tara:strand:- start:68 stop:955 length:888 start_codon:yes stop_codon:yes gene_type:complete